MITSKDSALDYLYAYQEGKIKKDYKINVSIKNGSLRILSKKNIKGTIPRDFLLNSI